MNKLIYIHYYYNDEKDLGIPLETKVEITDKITISTKYIDYYDIKKVNEEVSTFDLNNELWNEIDKLKLEKLNDNYYNDSVGSKYKVVLNNKVIEGNYYPEEILDLRYLLNIKEIVKAESLKIQEKVLKGD